MEKYYINQLANCTCSKCNDVQIDIIDNKHNYAVSQITLYRSQMSPEAIFNAVSEMLPTAKLNVLTTDTMELIDELINNYVTIVQSHTCDMLVNELDDVSNVDYQSIADKLYPIAKRIHNERSQGSKDAGKRQREEALDKIVEKSILSLYVVHTGLLIDPNDDDTANKLIHTIEKTVNKVIEDSTIKPSKIEYFKIYDMCVDYMQVRHDYFVKKHNRFDKVKK